MKRPSQHITDATGETQMRAIFEPLGWNVNSVVRDYGIDFDVEVFRDYESTGIAFKVQLKSSQRTHYSKNSDFLSQKMNIANAERLSHELRGPVILISTGLVPRSLLRKVYWMSEPLHPQEP